jgi:predicted amidohydrolase
LAVNLSDEPYDRGVLVAAIQMEAVVADLAANLEQAERLGDEAGAAGADWIVLPEFFTTGIGFTPELADAALAPDGEATQLLRELAARHGAWAGGSFLCRDSDGHVRNAFMLASPGGGIAGRHDKDLPTMWENSFYVGGEDAGILDADGMPVGVALCWELMRTQTVRRLRGAVDLVVGGSGWWSMPEWPPRRLMRQWEADNAATARRAAESFATYVGAPVVHAAHAGPLGCAMPWSPLPYKGHFQGGALVCAGDGTVLARRDRKEGAGFVVAEVEPGRTTPSAQPPDRFWLHDRGAMAAFTWSYQRRHGRRWYERHVAGRPPAKVEQRTRVPA